MPKWWAIGNTLALVDAMRTFARQQDGGWEGPTQESLNSNLIGAARQIGMREDDIRAAFASDACLTIYEP